MRLTFCQRKSVAWRWKHLDTRAVSLRSVVGKKANMSCNSSFGRFSICRAGQSNIVELLRVASRLNMGKHVKGATHQRFWLVGKPAWRIDAPASSHIGGVLFNGICL